MKARQVDAPRRYSPAPVEIRAGRERASLNQMEAAALLEVTERTVQRRWQQARLQLFDAMHGELPPGD